MDMEELGHIEWDFEETCPCGSLFRSIGDHNEGMTKQLSEWRVKHADHKVKRIE